MMSAKFPVVCEAHGGTRRNFGQRVEACAASEEYDFFDVD